MMKLLQLQNNASVGQWLLCLAGAVLGWLVQPMLAGMYPLLAQLGDDWWLQPSPAQPSPAQPRPLPTFIQIVKKKAGGEAHFRLPDFSAALQHHSRLQTADCSWRIVCITSSSLTLPLLSSHVSGGVTSRHFASWRSHFTLILTKSEQTVSRYWLD